MKRVTYLSVLVPAYNEEECLELLYNRVTAVLNTLDCESEILFVNDGSTDNSIGIMKKLQSLDSRVAYLDLSRNYGKETAMKAGIDYIRGDALVIIDADLQDQPEIIVEMIAEIENGYDDVYAKRMSRKDETWFKQITSKIYYRILTRISNVPIQEDTGDFRMLSKKAITALRELKESERNMKALFSYIGFHKKAIYYDRAPRVAGTTKWNYMQLAGLAIKGFTSFSIAPLRIVSVIGFIVSVSAFAFLFFIVTKTLLYGDPVSGYPTLMTVILFLGGVQLLAVGIIGEYLGIIYSETKRRPIYYVNDYKG